MSLTKNYIGELQEQAAAGNIQAIATLSEAGLWETVEEHQAREEWAAADESDEETDDEFPGDDEPFDDNFADAEALASAGFGTDEDYGSYGGDDF